MLKTISETLITAVLGFLVIAYISSHDITSINEIFEEALRYKKIMAGSQVLTDENNPDNKEGIESYKKTLGPRAFFYVQRLADKLQDYGNGITWNYESPEDLINEVEKAVTLAKLSGADLAFLESQLPFYKKQAKAYYAREMVDKLHNRGIKAKSKSVQIQDAKIAIEKAKTEGVDVTSLEFQIATIKN